MIWRSIYVALKRTLKNPLFLAMLVLLCFCVLFFGSIEKKVEQAPVGVTCRDKDPEALRLMENMAADGFVIYPDEEALCRDIRNETISMGVAIKEGLTQRMEDGDVESAVVLYCMPTSSFVKVASLRISAHLGESYAPYITQRFMEDIHVELTHEQVREYMEQRLQSDAQFEFSITDMQGKSLERSSYSRSLILGMLAVLLFCLFALCTCTEKDGAFRNLHDRLGNTKAFFLVLLPSYGVKYVITLAVAGGASVACSLIYGTDVAGLALRCGVYLLFLCGVAGLLYALLYNFSRVQLYVMLMSLLSLAVCPIFVDVGMFSQFPAWVRLLLPPYYFYQIQYTPVACTIGAVAVCVLGLGALWFRESRIPPRTRV